MKANRTRHTRAYCSACRHFTGEIDEDGYWICQTGLKAVYEENLNKRRACSRFIVAINGGFQIIEDINN